MARNPYAKPLVKRLRSEPTQIANNIAFRNNGNRLPVQIQAPPPSVDSQGLGGGGGVHGGHDHSFSLMTADRPITARGLPQATHNTNSQANSNFWVPARPINPYSQQRRKQHQLPATDSAECVLSRNVTLSQDSLSAEKSSDASLAPLDICPDHINDCSSNNNSSSQKRDSFDDPTMNWDEAVKLLDQVESATNPLGSVLTAKLASSPPRPTETKNFLKPSPVINNPYRASPHEEPLSSNAVGSTTTIIATRAVPKTIKSSYYSNQVKELAYIRPQSWLDAQSINSNQSSPTARLQKQHQQPNLPQPQIPLTSLNPSKNHQQLPLIEKLPKSLQYDPAVVDKGKNDDGLMTHLNKHADLNAVLNNGATLYPYQKRAVLRSVRMRRFILALDMGLGKTVIACVWAKAFQKTFPGCNVIVICPASMTDSWIRSARDFTGLNVPDDEKTKLVKKEAAKKKAAELKAAKSKKRTGKRKDDQTDFETLDAEAVTVDEDMDAELDGSDDDHFKMVQLYTWAKVPTVVEGDAPYVVICDEAHMMQSITAARTKEVLKLVNPARCKGVLLLTGTPMKNGKPSNLFPLLKAVDHPLGHHKLDYETFFCEGRQRNFGRVQKWDASGSANLDVLRELRKSHMMVLTKEECLEELPPLEKIVKKVLVSTNRRQQHWKALEELVRIEAMSKATDSSPDIVMGALQRFRMVGAVAKVDAAVNLAKNVLESEPAIVIFTNFKDVAKSIHEKLGNAGWNGEILTGETLPKKRQALVDKFQEGISPVFVCTYGAGGVGLTLTAARSVILVERPWTPGEVNQAIDRVRRIGQKHKVTAYWITAFKEDTFVDDVIDQKNVTSNTVLNHGANPDISNDIAKTSILRRLIEHYHDVGANGGISNGGQQRYF